MSIHIRIAAGALTLILSGVGSAIAATIDDFSGTQSGVATGISLTGIGPVILSEVSVPGAIGGSRETTLTGVSFDVSGVDSASATYHPQALSGFLDYESSIGATADLGVSYGPSLAADFSADALVRVALLDFDFAGGAAMGIDVTLDDGVNLATVSGSVNTQGPQLIDFLFADFLSQAPALDLTAIDSIEVLFQPGKSADFRVDSITTQIPEPASAALLTVGAFALAVRRKRRVLQ